MGRMMLLLELHGGQLAQAAVVAWAFAERGTSFDRQTRRFAAEAGRLAAAGSAPPAAVRVPLERRAATAMRRVAGLAALLPLCALVTPAHGETGANAALKNTAVAGAIATWAVALFQRAPVGDCLVHGNPGGTGAEWGVRIQGGKDAELQYGLLAAERRNCFLTDAAGWSLDVSPIVGVSYWRSAPDSSYAHRAWDAVYVPMLHWRRPLGGQTSFDIELGIGPAYLSEAGIGNRLKSTRFQLSDHFGFGIGSPDGKWRVAFEFRHISNLSIQTPNAAVNYKGVAISYRP